MVVIHLNSLNAIFTVEKEQSKKNARKVLEMISYLVNRGN